MRTYLAGLVLGAITLSAATAWAHHSFSSQYDVTRPSHLKGKVTKIEWANPHVFVMLNAKDAAGAEVQWRVEVSTRAILESVGWNRDTVLPGMDIRVGGYPAKDGSNHFGSTVVTLTATQRIFKTPECWWVQGDRIKDLKPSPCPILEVP